MLAIAKSKYSFNVRDVVVYNAIDNKDNSSAKVGIIAEYAT